MKPDTRKTTKAVREAPTASQDRPRFSWTQPSCVGCWNAKNPDRQAHTVVGTDREEETCVYCGHQTRSGIYVRVDPTTAAHPTIEKD